MYVEQRDLLESPPQPIDLSGWNGHEVEVTATELPTLQPEPVEGLANPEVKL